MKVVEHKIGNGAAKTYDNNIAKAAEEREKVLDRVGEIYPVYFSDKEKEQTIWRRP